MLPVSVGCSYNRCKFCILFKHLQYRELPLEQIEQELQRVKRVGGDPERVFLGDGNAFQLETDRLLTILELVRRYFPSCRAVNMDATVTSVSQKSDQALVQLAQAGVSRLYLGIESGLDDVLTQMDKDHNLAQAYRQIERMQQAGMIYDAHMMTGVAGKGRGLENARATAAFFNRTRPSRIVNFSMFVHRSAPLYREIEAGRFQPATELENLEEDRLLLQLLEDWPAEYDGFHDHILIRVRGTLPQDRAKMLDKLDREIEKRRDLPPEISWAR
jgi:radical SAM superfamily enzyme YgiQ (UPF0313 family)